MPYTILFMILLSCFTLNEALGLAADVNVEKSDDKAKTSKNVQKVPQSGKAPMRIEEPDGTLRPIPPSAMPQSRMSTEGLQEVPDAGGGTKVDVEGRFQSILKVPEGSNKAVHGEPQDLQPKR